MSIFTKIGQFFVGLFNAAKKTYNKLSPEEQAALQNGTGIVAIINGMTENTAAEILAAIQKKFPNVDAAKLEAALFQVAAAFGLTHLNNVEEVIEALKTKLAGLEGKAWALVSHAIASIFAIAFAPMGTKVAVVVSLIEFVYQHFIKKSTGE